MCAQRPKWLAWLRNSTVGLLADCCGYIFHRLLLRGVCIVVVADDSLESQPPGEPPLAGENVMSIVMVGAECAPWSKTGGLGDVMGALPKAFARRGHRVMVVAPRYENYDNAWETGVRRIFKVCNQDVEVRGGWRLQGAGERGMGRGVGVQHINGTIIHDLQLLTPQHPP